MDQVVALGAISIAFLNTRGMLTNMRISSKSKIAFDVILDIAAHTQHGHAISMPLISQRHGLSLSYLELIFAALKSSGMIRSHRGPGGGYSLVHQPETISLRDIVTAIDGEPDPSAELGAELWADLQSFMLEKMSQITLDAVLRESNVKIEPSTKGLSCMKPEVKVKASGKSPEKALKKSLPKKLKPQLGPNSIFSLGKYLALNKS